MATVVFADLVGYTTLSERRDPEQVKALLDRIFARLAADVTAFGGRVDKIVGDAIVALFGAPVAHEDDAERAVRSALQMQLGMADWRDTDPEATELSLRVGINTGEVLVGAPSSGEYTATGDVVNVASRLQTMASPGQVIVGPDTWSATRNAVRYVALGPIRAKGRVEPIQAWAAVEALAPPGYRPRRLRAPLVGRDHELALVCNALATCTARRRAHLVLLLGDAGVGKSRLAEELAAAACRDHGALVLEGRCVPYGEANAWWPVAEALRQACGIAPNDSAETSAAKCRSAVARATDWPEDSTETTRVVDGLLHLMGDRTKLADVDPTRARDERRRAIQMFLEALARRRPVVLILSELHWADDSVLDGLDVLLDGLGSLPFLLVATARPELEGRWRPRPGRHNTVLLTLDPLDDEATTRLLTSLLGVEPAPDVRALLLERSGGNPFFLEELAALLGEAGVAALDPSSTALETRPAALLGPAAVSELPATLRGLVAARLDALPSDERSTLVDAAIVGRTGPMEALERLGEATAADDWATLHRLVVKDLLVVDGGEFAFRSDLVREVAYETLTKAERARRHLILAHWLGNRMRELNREDEETEQVAYHLTAAAQITAELGPIAGVPSDISAQAVDTLLRAAERADQRDLHGAAIRFLDEALPLAPGDQRLRRRILLARAKNRAGIDDVVGARRDLEEVEAAAAAANDEHALARALIVKGDIEQREAHFVVAATTLGQAAEAMAALGDQPGRAEALRRMAMALLVGGDADAAEGPITDALTVARALGLRRDEAWALQNLAWISFLRDDPLTAEDRLQESMVAFADVGDYGGKSWALGLLGWVRFQEGKLDQAESLATQIMDELETHGDRWAHAMITLLLACIRLWQGATEDAVRRAAPAVKEFAAFDDVVSYLRATAPLIRGLLALGRVDEGLDVLETARGRVGDGELGAMLLMMLSLNAGTQIGDTDLARRITTGATNVPVHAPGWSEAAILIGLAALQQGDASSAVSTIEQALSRIPQAQMGSFARSTLALALAATGRLDEAVEAASAVDTNSRASYHDRMVACLASGFARLRQGEADQSELAFRGAIEAVDPTGDRVAQALARLGHARALAASGDERATSILAEANDRLDALGLTSSGWDTAFRLAAGEVLATRV